MNNGMASRQYRRACQACGCGREGDSLGDMERGETKRKRVVCPFFFFFFFFACIACRWHLHVPMVFLDQYVLTLIERTREEDE